jgi:hypothetical protein
VTIAYCPRFFIFLPHRVIRKTAGYGHGPQFVSGFCSAPLLRYQTLERKKKKKPDLKN